MMCPICGKESAELKEEYRVNEYKGESLNTLVNYYECVDCDFSFTTNELDDQWFYRLRTNHRNNKIDKLLDN